jgi:hypothetical protein
LLVIQQRWAVDFWYRDVWNPRMPLALDLWTRRGLRTADRLYGRGTVVNAITANAVALADLQTILPASLAVQVQIV